MRIAYFGDENSHTYAAAKYSFEDGENLFTGCKTIRECFEAVESGRADVAVTPLENSVEGTVRDTLDALNSFAVYIHRVVNMPIRQALVAFRGAAREDIKTIYSHYQALSQCKNYLAKNFPQVEIIAAGSTSEALKKVTGKEIAAIARKSGGAYTTVLEKEIEDHKSNETRFAVIGKMPQFEGSKCSVIFDTADKPGALLSVLNELYRKNVNMTKLESRPKGDKLGRYVFLTDFDFDGSKEELTALLAELSAKTNFLKFLGKYNCVTL